MTIAQERAAYRKAVLAVMVDVFHQDQRDASKIVLGWWRRLSQTSAFKSGIFMHSEPLHAVADLLGIEELGLSAKDRRLYDQILETFFEPTSKLEVGEERIGSQPLYREVLELPQRILFDSREASRPGKLTRLAAPEKKALRLTAKG